MTFEVDKSASKLEREIAEAYNLNRVMKGDHEALRDAALSVSAELARAGWLKGQALRDHGMAQLAVVQAEEDVKRFEALSFVKLRESLDGGKDSKGRPKPPTVDQISASVRTEPQVEEARMDLQDTRLAEVDAKFLTNLCWDLVEAYKLRGSMINSLAADRRAELSTDNYLKKMAREAREDRENE